MNKRTIYTFAVGNLPMRNRRKLYQTVEYFKLQPGFIGLHPHPPRGTLLVFDTLNNAKRARNIFEDNGIQCGNYIMRGTLTDDNLNLFVEGVAE